MVYYYPDSGQVYLLGDSGYMLYGSLSSRLSSSECRIETDSNWNASTGTLNLHLSFLAGLQGVAEIGMDAYDSYNSLDSGPIDGGPWDTRSPMITSFSPAMGPPGTVVTIVGTDFGSSQGTVTFNGAAATISSWSATQITASVPGNASTGPITVTAGGMTATSASNFQMAPVISSFSPSWAVRHGGLRGPS